MNKRELIVGFIKSIEDELHLIKQAAIATHEAATHEESKPENQYDTRGLEAAYLAGAQAKRATEMSEVVTLFKTLSFKDLGPEDKVQATALVDIKIDGKQSKVLMMPKGGGITLSSGPETVQIVTPQSLLGECLIGMKVGQITEFEIGSKVRECEIMGIC